MSWLVPLRHSATVLPVKRGPEADMFSSTPHRKLLFSMITLCAATVDSASASHPENGAWPSRPVSTRRWLRITSWPLRSIPPRMIVIPGEGAVCPATVR